jgi:hypothetical protein
VRYKTYLFVCLVLIFLIFGSVFGFILTAKVCCCPGWFLERIVVLPEIICWGGHYLVSSGNQVAIWGKASSRAQRIQMLIR